MKKNGLIIGLSIGIIIALGAIYVLWPRSTSPELPVSNSVSEPTMLPSDWGLHVISDRGGGPDGVRLFDMNGDGLRDVVSAFESSGEILVFLHPGVDNLNKEWPSVVVGNVPRGEDAFGIDINEDGNADVFSSHEGDTLGLFVHWAPPNPEDYLNPDLWMSERIEVADGHGWMFAVIMDVNEDGRVDIVAGSKDDFFNDRNSVGELAWLETPTEDRAEWLYHPIDHVGWPMSIDSIDLDKDGDLDVLVSDQNADEEHQGLRWLENPGQDWEEEWTSHFVADLAGTRPTFLGIGDMDRDGVEDLVVPLRLKRKIVFVDLSFSLKSNFAGNATFIQTSEKLKEGFYKAVGLADIDLDGYLEIIYSTDRNDLGLGYFDSSNGALNGIWTRIPIFDSVSQPKYDRIAIYDIDGDGDEDILTTEERQGLGVIWLENPTISDGD